MKFDSTMKFYVGIVVILIVLVIIYPYTTSIGQFVRGSSAVRRAPIGNVIPIIQCNDTDGNLPDKFWIKGFTTGIEYGSNEYIEVEDFCETDYNLVEYYCSSQDNTVQAVSRTCYGGCVDGACIWTTQCPLTDVSQEYPQGDDPYTKGIFPIDGAADECRDSSGDGDCDGSNGCEVYERFCGDGGINAQTSILCPNGCSDGACLHETVTYEGVLQMLNSCYNTPINTANQEGQDIANALDINNDGNLNGDEICGYWMYMYGDEKTCILSQAVDANTVQWEAEVVGNCQSTYYSITGSKKVVAICCDAP